MNSCLYEIDIMHCRLRPKRYQFTHRVFMFYLDLDEIDAVARKVSLVSRNRFNFYNFADIDHVQPESRDIKAKILEYIGRHGVDLSGGKIMLLTSLRMLGYGFNPVSFYFCFNAKGDPVCAVVEISNTFREMKLFWLGPEHLDKEQFHSRETKYFYISPFIDLDVPMDFRLTVPGDRLKINIDDYKDGEKFLISSMNGHRKELNSWNLFLYTLCFPFITLKVIGLIHWHAFILHYIKKIPYHLKESNQHLQQEVLRVWHKH